MRLRAFLAQNDTPRPTLNKAELCLASEDWAIGPLQYLQHCRLALSRHDPLLSPSFIPFDITGRFPEVQSS